MNLILFEQHQNEWCLPPQDHRRQHLRKIVRAGVGDTVYVGVLNGPRVWAAIVSDDASVGMRLVAQRVEPPLPMAPITLLVGLPRPQTARRVLFEAACQGCAELVFFGSDRGEPSYRQSRLWQTEEWQRHLREGAEQGCATLLPQVSHAATLDRVPKAAGHGMSRVALDVYEGSAPLSHWLSVQTTPMVAALGPERGWSARERDLLRSRGFALAHLGQRVLKVETALTATITLVRAHLGEC